MIAEGDYGTFEGSASDQIVFGTYRQTGTWSPLLIELLTRHLFAGGPGTLIDVGANIGLVTIPVLDRTQAQAFAFEPEPRNHARLRANVRRHALQSRVQSYQLALAAEAGLVSLALCEHNSGDHRLAFDSSVRDRTLVTVEANTLDDVLGGRAPQTPVVMKVDTQGAEARVLRGAQRTLQFVDYLVIEYWPAGLLRMGNSAAELHELLLGFPYGAYLNQHVLPEQLVPTAALLSALSFIATDGSDEGFVDLLFSRHLLKF